MTQRSIVVGAIVGILSMCVTSARINAQPAQNYPGAAFIEQAAAQMNSITPPPMPEQLIMVGDFDGRLNTFICMLPATSTPGPFGRGNGPVEYIADIASYNVTYFFNISSKPAGFAITLTQRTANGDSVIVPAVIDPTGTKATIRFHPTSFARQSLRFRKPQGETILTITPHLRAQLGAFVVPYLLVGLVYEPPGAQSNANYSQTKTQNTVIAWQATSSSGIVQTIDPNKFIDLANQAIGAGLNQLQPGVGTAWTTITGLFPNSTVTRTTSTTTGTGQSTGFSIAVTVGFSTVLHEYPGNGDLFIILHDVLFAYLAKDGKVTLAPIMYAGPPDYMTAAEMTQKLPAKVAASFKALDPHFGKATIASLPRLGMPSVVLAGGLRFWHPRLVPFQPITSVACKSIGSITLDFAQGDFTSTTSSDTQSETDVTHNTGLIASIFGGGDSSYTTSYTTSREQESGQTQSTTITLLCAGSDQFWVDVYFDNLFRTFYTLAGDPLSPTPPIVGTAQRPDGRAIANQQVRLHAGDRTYVVMTDKEGNFAFPVRATPNGASTLTVGGQSYALTLSGRPRNLLVKAGVVTDRK